MLFTNKLPKKAPFFFENPKVIKILLKSNKETPDLSKKR